MGGVSVARVVGRLDGRMKPQHERYVYPQVTDLRPTVAKIAVADDQHLPTLAVLTRHGLHAVGTTAWDKHGVVRIIHLVESSVEILHYVAERSRHVVEGAIGVDHRVFQETTIRRNHLVGNNMLNIIFAEREGVVSAII